MNRPGTGADEAHRSGYRIQAIAPGRGLAAIDADTAVANPVTGDQTAPWSDGLYPVPTAVRFVGTGTWAIQQAATAVRS